jgi:hypothetical protein
MSDYELRFVDYSVKAVAVYYSAEDYRLGKSRIVATFLDAKGAGAGYADANAEIVASDYRDRPEVWVAVVQQDYIREIERVA